MRPQPLDCPICNCRGRWSATDHQLQFIHLPCDLDVAHLVVWHRYIEFPAPRFAFNALDNPDVSCQPTIAHSRPMNSASHDMLPIAIEITVTVSTEVHEICDSPVTPYPNHCQRRYRTDGYAPISTMLSVLV